MDNTLPKWYLETLGVYVSKLNNCTYCVDHHFAGLVRLIRKEKAEEIWKCLSSEEMSATLGLQYASGMYYAKQLTLHPDTVNDSIIATLRENGFDDGEILEVNQVVSYFNYANRTVLGLGATTEGDVLGLSPNKEDSEDWGHG